MRIFLTSMYVAAAFAAVLCPARAADATFVGGMSAFNYLLGGPWSCTTTLPAMGGQPAHTDHVTLTFDVAPGNTAHDHVAGAEYMGDDYYGYNPDAKLYWSASADNIGNHGAATSKDGQTYIGTSSMGPMTFNVSSTYAKVSASSVTMHEVLSGGGHQAIIDSSCTR